jgi:hypothetical protein
MLTPKEHYEVCLHEGGHAATSYHLGGTPLFLRVEPHADPARGVMRDMGLKSAQDQISVHLAGMAMDRLMGSDISHGYEKDYRNVWKIAFDAFPHWADAIKAVKAAERKIDRLVRDVAPGAMLLGAELYKPWQAQSSGDRRHPQQIGDAAQRAESIHGTRGL